MRKISIHMCKYITKRAHFRTLQLRVLVDTRSISKERINIRDDKKIKRP